MIGAPDEKPKPPNGLIRRDSFHDIGSDSEMDEPFFNFDSDEMDDEELYAESLLEELKKQQVRKGRKKIICIVSVFGHENIVINYDEKNKNKF